MDHLNVGDLLILKADGWLAANMPTTGDGYSYAGTSLVFYPRLPHQDEDWKPTSARDFAEWGMTTNGQDYERRQQLKASLMRSYLENGGFTDAERSIIRRSASLSAFRPAPGTKLAEALGFIGEDQPFKSLIHYKETPKTTNWIFPVSGYDGSFHSLTIISKGEAIGLLIGKNRKHIRFTGIGAAPFASCEFSVLRKKKFLTAEGRRYADEFISPDDLF
jgi:hypothetical protein